MKSWKTTVGGVGMILSGLAIFAEMLKSGNFDGDKVSVAIAAIIGGFGLVFARDNNVSSEEAGAIKK